MPTTPFTLIPSNAIFSQNDNLVTTSLKVAEAFGKRHTHVLDKLKSLDCSDEFASANFWAHVQMIDIGNGAKRESKFYQMTKDGFMFLVMGFTGKKAATIKEAYINAFNQMAAKIYTPSKTISPSQQSEIQQTIGKIAAQFEVLERPAIYSKLYARLKRVFKVARYDQIPANEFDHAMSLLHDNEVKGLELPDPDLELLHYSLNQIPKMVNSVSTIYYSRDLLPTAMGALLNELANAERKNKPIMIENVATAIADYQGLVRILREQRNRLKQIDSIVSDFDIEVRI